MLKGFWEGFVDLLYPKRCLACKNKLSGASIDGLVCVSCWSQIKKNTPPFCHSCGRRLEKKDFAKSICADCRKNSFHFDRAFSPCSYTGIIKELIHEFKYNGKDHLGQTLSGLMVEFIKEYSLPMGDLDLIVPLPMHKTRLREKEFNQAEVLAEALGRAFARDIAGNVLGRSRLSRTQTELSVSERFSNVRESFRVLNPGGIRGKNILLVDDVLTTGATSSEAARAMKEAGAGIVFVLTLAN
jgi:ComF family protein